MKQNNTQEIERRKRKALYGTRASSKIFESAAVTSRRSFNNGSKKIDEGITSKQTARQSWKEKIIIDAEGREKALFDVVILILVGYSCVTTVFHVAFNPATDTKSFAYYFDKVVEYLFILDLLLNFITNFPHPETYETVTEFREIAKNYLWHGSFFIDFISVFPFEAFFQAGKVAKMLRLFRLPRLVKLFDISKFNRVVKALMSNSSRDERIVAQYMMLYIYKIVRLIIIAIIITYFIGCFWYMFCVLYTENQASEGDGTETTDTAVEAATGQTNFIKYNNLEGLDNSHKLIISCYFALTTLSTVGYGDYYPVSNIERTITVVIMLCGVAFFSFIMGNFIEIISNYEKKMGVVDKNGDLHNWLILLTRFNNNSPLPKLITS